MAKKDADMTQGTIWKQFVSFSIPLMIGLLFQQLYNTVDTIVVGQFVGKDALAAVGSTASIMNMVVSLYNGLSIGASVIISQSYGAHDNDRLGHAVHTTISLSLILCVISTLLGVLIVDPMLRAMQTPDDVFAGAHNYLTICFSGMSGMIMYNMGSAILRAVGDSRRPLYFLIFSAILNTILDIVFVVLCRWGISGVAVATITSQLISALLIMLVLTLDKGPYAIHWNRLELQGKQVRKIMDIGLPSGIQQAITAFSNVFVQSYINQFGAACMAGWSSYNKLDAFVLIPVMAIGQASTTFVGQNYGAGKMDRARKGVSQALTISLICTMVLMAALWLLADEMVSLFTQEEDVLAFGIRFVRMITPFYFTICFNQIYGGALRGIGDAKTPTIIMLSSFVVFRQIYLAVTKALGMGITAVSLGYPMGWIMCSTLLIIWYRRSALCKTIGRKEAIAK